MARCSTGDVAFLALARDCAATLPAALAWFSELEGAGLRNTVIVGENGSRDATRGQLDAAARAGRLRLEDTSFMSGSPRLRRMAEGRDFMAARLADLATAFRFVCVLDLDDPMRAPPAVDAFIAAMHRLDSSVDLFALSATSLPTYYDLLAFDDGRLSFDHLLDEIKASEKNPLAYYRLFRDRIYPHQQALSCARDIPCLSSFNGLAMYKFEDYRSGSYVERSNFGICEHLTFNRSIAHATGRAMVIDPGLTVGMPSEHGRRSFVGFWMQRLRKSAARLTA